MTVTKLPEAPERGVVEFGPPNTGFSVLVENRVIPRLMVKEHGGDLITIVLDDRFAIDVPRHLSGQVCWMIANALAIGQGYAFLGSPDKSKPFAPEAIGLSKGPT